MTTIKSFIERLAKIGIKVELTGNIPWIYLKSVNDIPVMERFHGNHGFTVFFTSVKVGQKDKITDIPKIFQKIRQILNNGFEKYIPEEDYYS